MQVMFCLSKFHLETSVKNKLDLKKKKKKKLAPLGTENKKKKLSLPGWRKKKRKKKLVLTQTSCSPLKSNGASLRSYTFQIQKCFCALFRVCVLEPEQGQLKSEPSSYFPNVQFRKQIRPIHFWIAFSSYACVLEPEQREPYHDTIQLLSKCTIWKANPTHSFI